MKEGMVSINKPFTDNIFDRIKKIEWRKKPLPLGINEVYETKNKGGCGKVIGTMYISRNFKFDPLRDTHDPRWIEQGCVPIELLIAYANGGVIYGNVIESAQRYDKPKEIGEFIKHGFDKPMPVTRPPQSWMYVEKLGV